MKLTEITCISDLYYVAGRWFTVAMVCVAFATVPFALDKWDSVFSFLMCAGIAFVGVAAHYKDKTDYPVHFASAGVSAVCSVVWTIHCEPWCLLCLLIALVGVADRTRWLMWCEVPCFLMAYLCLIL